MKETTALAENAYTPLKPGESYEPVVSARTEAPELTARAVFWGVVFCILFSVASAYSGLKVGQGMEAAIPISILAIGLARAFRRRSTLLENMIVTGIGAASGSVAAGAIFTLPALYILNLNPHPLQTIFIGLAGGCLGVLFVIPLRHYFVREMHGKLPFPEATAITEVLVTGEKGGSQAKLLIEATALATVYDFLATSFHTWQEYINLQFVPAVRALADRGRMVFNFDAVGFILGLGYVMGLRSALVFCAGGVLTNFVLTPAIWFVGSHLNAPVYPGTTPISLMSAQEIYRNYVRFIGVGAIATAGIFGVLKSMRVIAGSFSIALKAFHHGEATAERTERDLPMLAILAGAVLITLAVGLFFADFRPSWLALLVGLTLVLLFSFFFTSVAANSIATTANNPASGMTMLTVIVSSLVLLNFGLSGTTGMFFVMAIAGMVCTALCVSGQFVTDLKAGYWLGSTPAAQQKVKFLGVVVAAIASSLTIILLAHTFQFGEAAPGDARQVLAAPQASIMKALVVGFMSHQPVAYLLFGIGAMISVVMEMLGKSSLVFALGLYLPLGLTSPILAGGLLSHLVNRRAEKTEGEAGKSIRERGVILASGLMAGGALGGVLGAALRLFPFYREDLIATPFYANMEISQMVSAVLFLGLCVFVWRVSLGGRTKEEV